DRSVSLLISGFDGIGQTSEVHMGFLVERSRRLAPLVVEPGKILDFDGDRTLFVGLDRLARVRHLDAGAVDRLDGVTAGSGILIDGAALITSAGLPSIYELREGSASSIAVPGANLL